MHVAELAGMREVGLGEPAIALDVPAEREDLARERAAARAAFLTRITREVDRKATILARLPIDERDRQARASVGVTELAAASPQRLDLGLVALDLQTEAIAAAPLAGRARALEQPHASLAIGRDAEPVHDHPAEVAARRHVAALARTREELGGQGIAMVLYPLSPTRAMQKAALNVMQAIRQDGTQKNVIDTMQTRAELYDFLGYHAYEDKLDELFQKAK